MKNSRKLANPNDSFAYPSHPGNRLPGQGDKGSAAIVEAYSKNLEPVTDTTVNLKRHSFTGPEFVNRFKKL